MTRLQVYEAGLPPRKRMEGLRNRSSRRFVGVGRREVPALVSLCLRRLYLTTCEREG